MNDAKDPRSAADAGSSAARDVPAGSHRAVAQGGDASTNRGEGALEPWSILLSEERLQRSFCLFVLPTAIVFGATHGLGLISAGFNVDDLFELKADPQWTSIGRYGMTFFYDYVLGGSYSDPFQIVAAYLTLAGCCRLLVPAWVRHRDLGAAMLFVAGITHPYFAEMLNFSAHVWAYPLALLLSLVAFRMSLSAWGRSYAIGRIVLAALLLAASLSLYQTFALFGSIVVLERLLHPTRRLAWTAFVAPLAVLVSGFVVYKLGDQIVLRALHQTASNRFALSLENLSLTRIGELVPVLWHLLIGKALFVPAAFARASTLVYAVLAFAITYVSLKRLRKRSILDALRMPVAAMGIAVPIMGPSLLIAAADLPARAVAGIGLVPPLLVLWLWTMAPGVMLRRALIGAIIVFAAFNVVTSSNIWTDQAHAAKRDEAVAAAVAGIIAQTEGVTRISLVGKQEYRDLWWNESLGMSALNTPWSRGWLIATFFPGIQVHSVGASPRPCSAFPSSGSIVQDRDNLFICLERTSVGFDSLERCVDKSETNGFEICMLRDALVMKSSACGRPGTTRFFLHHFRSGQETNLDFAVDSGQAWNGACYWVRKFPNDQGDYADIGEFELPNGRRLWEQRVQPSR